MHRWTDEWPNGWTMFLFCTDAVNASENADFSRDFAIFTKVSDRRTDGMTNPLKEMQ